MPAPVCIQNNILVRLDKAFQDQIITTGGLRLYKDVEFRPEWNATIEGEVMSVPLSVTVGDGKIQSINFDRPKINQIVCPGDRIIFSYLVASSRSHTDNNFDIFKEDQFDPFGDPYVTTWTNGRGLKLVRVYMQNNVWECGVFDTKSKEVIERMRGDELEVENFMGKHMPTKQVSLSHKNILEHEGRIYFKVDYSQAFAIKKSSGEFEMIGDYVLLAPISEPSEQLKEGGALFVYNKEQHQNFIAIGKIISIGEPLKGDKKIRSTAGQNVLLDIRYVEKYEIDGEDYWIVKQKYILGKTETP